MIRLSLIWQGGLSLVLDEDMSIKRLRFADVIEEKAADISDDDEAARFDNDFAIMTLELARFIPVLLEQFGGVNEDQDADTVTEAGDQVAA